MRDLTHVDIEQQAENLADYVSRGGDEARWWASKHFSSDDAREIRREYRRRFRGAA